MIVKLPTFWPSRVSLICSTIAVRLRRCSCHRAGGSSRRGSRSSCCPSCSCRLRRRRQTLALPSAAGAGAALPPPPARMRPSRAAVLHAANARMLTAASALTLCSFIQFSSKSPVVTPWRDPGRGPPGVAREALVDPAAHPPLAAVCGRRCAARATADGSCIRAARRWPPKRCRILADGDLNAIPVGRTLERVVGDPSFAAVRGSRAPVSPRSNPIEGHGRRTLRGWTRRRGIPGPSSPCHGHRSYRRA